MNSNASKNILLIDDDRALRELMKMSLELDGYEVVVAADGKKAVTLFEQGNFDLIVLDLVMPLMDGVCFIRWLRQEQHSETPVLIMSGAVRDGMDDELRSNGATDVLRKPVNLETLLQQVNGLL
jgi:DNA-binding response OmpR family regulator